MILHSQIIGEGKPFVILHGFLGMSDNWKTLGKQFATLGFQMHLVDQRNHGRSFHDDAFSYEIMAADIKTYCENYELEDIILLGHSMGGKTAMEFATRYPETVSKLIVADIGIKQYPQHHQDILKALNGLDFSEISTRNEAEEFLSHYIKVAGVRQFLLKNLYWIEKGQLALRMNLKVLTEHISEVGKPLKENAVFSKDTLFVRGGNSGYVEDRDEMEIKNHFPMSKIATIPNVGHWLHAENPTRFLEIIANFLQNEV